MSPRGGSINPNIFNMVVDAIIHNRVKVINGEEEEPEGFGLAVQCIAELLYAGAGRWTGIVYLESNILQHMMDMR